MANEVLMKIEEIQKNTERFHNEILLLLGSLQSDIDMARDRTFIAEGALKRIHKAVAYEQLYLAGELAQEKERINKELVGQEVSNASEK